MIKRTKLNKIKILTAKQVCIICTNLVVRMIATHLLLVFNPDDNLSKSHKKKILKKLRIFKVNCYSNLSTHHMQQYTMKIINDDFYLI